MLSYLQAIILGLLQGITELFPISSLGHSVILPYLLGWDIQRNSNYFLIFLVATHFSTALVLVFFFWSDWLAIIKGILRSLKNRQINTMEPYDKLGWLIIIATVPAGIVGIFFEKKLKLLFAMPDYSALFLLLNGVMLYGAEHIGRRRERSGHSSDARIAKLSWAQSFQVGCTQCLALLPGFSRTGATLGGGLVSGLNHEDAARFSFLLATPIIGAAAVLKLPELLISIPKSAFGPVVVGALVAAAAAYGSVRFLTKYFQSHTLIPFSVYCMIVGGLTFIFFFMR